VLPFLNNEARQEREAVARALELDDGFGIRGRDDMGYEISAMPLKVEPQGAGLRVTYCA